MPMLTNNWLFWAALSAVFAALTAIFAKVGVAGVNSDLATFLRTIVIVVVLAVMLSLIGEWRPLTAISPRTYLFLALSGLGNRRLVALLLSRLAVGAGGARRPDRQAQRRARGRVWRGLSRRTPVERELARRCSDRRRGRAGGVLGRDSGADAQVRLGGLTISSVCASKAADGIGSWSP